MSKAPTLTTTAGAPIADNQNSETAGPRGPLLMQDYQLIEKLAHQNRERIPERTVHAKGWGAYGTFTVTHDVTAYTKAKIFSAIGKKTDLIVRFSNVAGELGAADAERDVRGFAAKFYTEEGNWDLVGNNTPVFFIRDPYKFPDFIHTQKRHPRTNLRSPTAMWDFWSLSPESLHQVTILMSDRGLPRSPRFMNGYGSHTFSFINANDERFWVKFHFKTRQGIRPHADYPPIEVGVMELNRNPDNYFQEIELAAFSPSNVVPGISWSPDKVLQARIFSYADAHRYRLGTHYERLPVNSPRCPVHHYHKDGPMRFFEALTGNPDAYYEPNSFNGPAQDERFREPALKISGDADRYNHRDGNDDYRQPGDLFRLMDPDERTRLMDNIAEAMQGVPVEIVKRQIAHFYKADPDYGAGVASRMGVSITGLTAPIAAE